MFIDPRAIHIYTDGSCYGNPGGASGCAAIVEYPEHLHLAEEQIVDISCAESKIPRMELQACIRALEWIPENAPWPDVTRVQIITDCLYVKDNLNRARNWQQNDWRNSHGEPRENTDLWKRFLKAQSKTGMATSVEWAAGKKSPILKRIDTAAKNAAKRVKSHTRKQKRLSADVDYGYRPGTVVRSMVSGAATRFPAGGQAVVIRPYRKDRIRTHENKIRFDLFAEETQTYIASHYAYASPEMTADLHSHHGYRVRLNDDPHYPKILELIEEVPLPKPKAVV